MKQSPSNWTLVLHQGSQTLSFPVSEGVTTIGRDSECQICLPDTSVSREHAQIISDDKGLTLRDLDSRNGVRVNGVPRKQAALQAGDRIKSRMFACDPADTEDPLRTKCFAHLYDLLGCDRQHNGAKN